MVFIEHALVRTLLATLIAIAGGVLGVVMSTGSGQRRLLTLSYAAGGVLLAVTLGDILPDARQLLPWIPFLAAVASGFALFYLVGRFIVPLCPSCAVGEWESASMVRLRTLAPLLLIALGLHSLMDGLAVVIADRLIGKLEIGVLLAVSLHKLPEGLALALLLRGAGYRRRAALGWTVAIETTTELGGLLGLLIVGGVSQTTLGILFAHIGGGFLYLVASAFGALRTGREAGSEKGDGGKTPALCGALAFGATGFLLWGMSGFAR